MTTFFTVNSIGRFVVDDRGSSAVLDPEYAPGLAGLERYSHVKIIWWFSDNDTLKLRNTLESHPPHKGAPETVGVFAARSPRRPNPIGLTTAKILFVDRESGTVGISFTDARDGTPVLDLKPYSPAADRVEDPAVPEWCAHWPRSVEAAADFDWESERKGPPEK